MTIAYIALGANLGSPRQTFDKACQLLEPDVRIRKRSRLYQTKPYGIKDQPDFVNAAIEVETSLTHIDLMHRLQQIECQLGKKTVATNGPRTLDLDLIFYGSLADTNPNHTVPHPRAAQRDFVLLPLTDLNPDLVHPTLNQSVQSLLHNLSEHYFEGQVTPWPAITVR